MLTVKKAAKILGLHESTVRRLSKRGLLRTYRNYLGWRMFDPKDVEQLRRQLRYLQPDSLMAAAEDKDA